MKILRYFMFALIVAFTVSSCTEDATSGVVNPGGDEQKPDDGGTEGGDGTEDEEFVIDPTKDYPLISTEPKFISPDTTEDVYIIVNAKDTALKDYSGD
ncbi:MAG: hypothetical protein IJB56_02385, partial [Alistipes sp.]|nr:hypothetical protein [Alistipes sp.]